MPGFSRHEIEESFRVYQERAAVAAKSGDWAEWAEMFTEDAVYVEHHYGRFEGRDAIRRWINDTMAAGLNPDMNAFPVRWHMVDEDRGWILTCVINRMADVGDGVLHEADSWTLLHYAGNGQFSYEEDMYNPNEFAAMISSWSAARSGRG